MSEREDAIFKTTGCKWLLPISGYLGLTLDQVNFLACQLFALLAAFWFRLYLSPNHASPMVRHAVATLLGIAFLLFCFGWYSTHILAVVAVNYFLIIKADINNVHRQGFFFTLLSELARTHLTCGFRKTAYLDPTNMFNLSFRHMHDRSAS